jgi:hypothetical protein
MPLSPDPMKGSGLSAFKRSARLSYKQLVSLKALLDSPNPDMATIKRMVDTAVVHADEAKNLVEDEGGIASLLQGQTGALNLHIHVHTKD